MDNDNPFSLTESNFFIDEFKNKNYNTRIFYISRLTHICSLLSENQVHSTFIPFLNSLLTKFENTAEVFTAYARSYEQLIIFIIEHSTIQSNQNVIKESLTTLINGYFTHLLKNEDDITQATALTCFTRLIDYAYDKQCQILIDIFISYILNFTCDNNSKILYSMSVVLPYFYKIISSDEVMQKYQKCIESILSPNVYYPFKRNLLENLSNIIPYLNNEKHASLLSYINDICINIPNKEQNEFILINIIIMSYKLINVNPLQYKPLLSIMLDKINISTLVQLSLRLNQTFIEFIDNVQPIIKSHPNYLKYIIFTLKDNAIKSDPEVKIAMLTNIDKWIDKTQLTLMQGECEFSNMIIQIFQTVTVSDPNKNVRKALSKVLTRVLDKLISLSNLLTLSTSNELAFNDIYTKLLNDTVFEVKYEVVKHMNLNVFNFKYLYDVVISQTCINDTYWRIRLETLKNIFEMIKDMIRSNVYINEYRKQLLTLLKCFYKDKASDVRELTLEVIKYILDNSNRQFKVDLMGDFWSIQQEMLTVGTDMSYHLGVFAVKSVLLLKHYYLEQDYNSVVSDKVEKAKLEWEKVLGCKIE